jgi:hypothetical protein
MKDKSDEYVFRFKFVDGLLGSLASDVTALSDVKNYRNANLQDIIEIAQRMEDAAKMRVRSRHGASATEASHAGPLRRKPKGMTGGNSYNNNGKGKGTATSSNTNTNDPTTDGERNFLNSNISRGGGLIVHAKVQDKREWRAWAVREGRCLRCCAKGHISKSCTASPSAKPEPGRVNSMMTDLIHVGNSSGSGMQDIDYPWFCALFERKDTLMKYQCGVCQNSTDASVPAYQHYNGVVLLDTGATRNTFQRTMPSEQM